MRDAPEAGNRAPKDSLDGARLLVLCVCEAAEVGALKAWGQEGAALAETWLGEGRWTVATGGLWDVGAQSHRGDLKAGTPVTHRAQPSGYRLSGSRRVFHEELGD